MVIQTRSELHPASYKMGTEGEGMLSMEVKRQGHESDHSAPISAEKKKMWIYAFPPHIHLHVVVISLLSTGTTLPCKAESHKLFLIS
jgi:hypothetical protein